MTHRSAFRSAFAAALLLGGAIAATAADAVPPKAGLINFTFDAAHRDRHVQAMLWYPAERGSSREQIGDNVVFRGVEAWRDARPEQRKHPLVILSHGSGGNAPNLAWIASRIAKAGFVVALPTHQGTTSADSTPETTVYVWERTADMSALLDHLLASPTIGKLIDGNNVTAMGFSLGGQTALSLVGARSVAADLAKFCDGNPASPECVWFDRGGPGIPGHVDLHAMDAARFNASRSDPRFTRFVAIDPAFTPAYDAGSLKGIGRPGLVLSLGEGEEVPTGVRTDRMRSVMSGTTFETVPGATHFSFLGDCKPMSFFWLWMEGEDPSCTEHGDRSRAELHEEIAARILAFL